jgi:hypothetical protein
MGITSKDSSKVGCTIYLLIIIVICYFAFRWGEAQWNYESMKKETSELMKFLVTEKEPPVDKYKKILVDKAEQCNVDLYEEDIEITFNKNGSVIELYWETPVEFPGYTYYLKYDLVVSRKRGY